MYANIKSIEYVLWWLLKSVRKGHSKLKHWIDRERDREEIIHAKSIFHTPQHELFACIVLFNAPQLVVLYATIRDTPCQIVLFANCMRTNCHTQTHTQTHASWYTQTHKVGSPLMDLIEEIRCYPVISQPISAYIQK